MSRRSWASDYTRPCSCGRRECGDGKRLLHAARVGVAQGVLLYVLVEIAQRVLG